MISRRQNTDVGVVLGLALLVVGLVSGGTVWYQIAVLALLVTGLVPVIYTPLSWLWFGFALLVELLFSAIILTLIFYLIVTPMALLRKLFFKDILCLRSFKKGVGSVFVMRNKIYKAEDMENQF